MYSDLKQFWFCCTFKNSAHGRHLISGPMLITITITKSQMYIYIGIFSQEILIRWFNINIYIFLFCYPIFFVEGVQIICLWGGPNSFFLWSNFFSLFFVEGKTIFFYWTIKQLWGSIFFFFFFFFLCFFFGFKIFFFLVLG